MDVCVYRCSMRPPLKSPREKGFVDDHANQMKLSPGLKEYLRCAKGKYLRSTNPKS